MIKLRKNRDLENCLFRGSQDDFFSDKLTEFDKNFITSKKFVDEKLDSQYGFFTKSNNFNFNPNHHSKEKSFDTDAVHNKDNLLYNGVNFNANNNKQNEFFLIGSNFNKKKIEKIKPPAIVLTPEQILLENQKKIAEKITKDIISSIEHEKNHRQYNENFYTSTSNFEFEKKNFKTFDAIFNESSISTLANNFKTKYNLNMIRHQNKNFINLADRNIYENDFYHKGSKNSEEEQDLITRNEREDSIRKIEKKKGWRPSCLLSE